MPALRDLIPLATLQLALLIATLVLGPGNLADVRVQLTWAGFLILGWTIAPNWIGDHTSIIRRYLAAMITSIALHGLLVMIGSLTGFGIQTYVVLWIIATLVALVHRNAARKTHPQGRFRLPRQHLLLIVTLIVFAVCVYRTPRSNDIYQFMLQQQDMLAEGSLRVSSIGMSAMEIDQPMPRWKAHYWHVLPCVIAQTSGVAIDQVLLRYATIPVAYSVLLCLIETVRSLAGRQVSYPIALIAILGPVLYWYRNYTVFNESFRVTNNLLLDKDFAIFFLIPATLWLASGWIRGKQRYLIPLIGLIPALVRFHPLTAVYLLLLTAPTAVLIMPTRRAEIRRLITLVASSVVLFVAVVLIGDAQSNHEQIRDIIQMDYRQSLADRPLHYWVGFYNSIPDTNLPSDTTRWVGRRFYLKGSLILGCGLLLAMHACLLLLASFLIIGKRRQSVARVLLAGLVTASMLWGMWFISGSFLTRFPHYAAGYERLHWFAYSIAMVVIAAALTRCIPRRGRRGIAVAILIAVTVSSAFYRLERQSPLIHLRGINSLLDAEISGAADRRSDWLEIPSDRSLLDKRPKYLGSNDRALLLDGEATKHYWLTHQGVFWSDPYVEAFAWYHRGDEFESDRRRFYKLLDRKVPSDLETWITDKGITLIVDQRDGGDEFLEGLALQRGIPMRRIETGVWRIEN